VSNIAQSLPWHGGSFTLEAPRYVTGKVRSRSKFGSTVGFWPLLSPLAGQKRPADQLPILARGTQSFEGVYRLISRIRSRATARTIALGSHRKVRWTTMTKNPFFEAVMKTAIARQ
jgi:hypothetical protein